MGTYHRYEIEVRTYPEYRRTTVMVEVPPGATEAEIERNMERAVDEYCDKQNVQLTKEFGWLDGQAPEPAPPGPRLMRTNIDLGELRPWAVTSAWMCRDDAPPPIDVRTGATPLMTEGSVRRNKEAILHKITTHRLLLTEEPIPDYHWCSSLQPWFDHADEVLFIGRSGDFGQELVEAHFYKDGDKFAIAASLRKGATQ